MWGLSDEALGAIVSALALVVAAVLQGPKIWRNRRSDVLKDLEIYKSLPDESSAKAPFLLHIDDRVSSLIGNGEKRRNPLNAGIGIAFLLVAAWLTYLVISIGQWWAWFALPVLLFFWVFGIYGTIEGFTKLHRDVSGKAIPK